MKLDNKNEEILKTDINNLILSETDFNNYSISALESGDLTDKIFELVRQHLENI